MSKVNPGVKFLHFRAFDESEILARGGATVAYVVGEAGVTYAIAYCSDRDNYNKAIGRHISSNRLLSSELSATFNLEAETVASVYDFLDFIEAFMETYGYNRNYKS